MFRSSTIIRKLALNLVKVTFTLKIRGHYVVNYDAVVWQHVMEWRVCVARTACNTHAIP
jgi:hypothetical protein